MHLAMRVIVAGAALVGLAACGDGVLPPTPDAKQDGAQSDALRKPSAFTLIGNVTVTVRRLDVGGPLGTVVSTEAGTYAATIDGEGRATGTMALPDGVSDATILAADRPGRGGGGWSRRSRSQRGAEDVTVWALGSDGGPTSEWEVRRGSAVVTRTANVWKRLNGAWRLSQRVTTTYQGSRPVLSVTHEFDAGDVRPPQGLPLASMLRAPADRAAFEEYGVCESEMNAVQDAFDVYEASTLGFLGCLKGPTACIGATTAYVLAYRRLVRAFDRADACLDAY